MNIVEITPDDITRKSLDDLGIVMLKDESALHIRGSYLDEDKATVWENFEITLGTGEADKSVLYLIIKNKDIKVAIPYVRDWKTQDGHILLNAPTGSYINEMMNQHFQTIINEVKSEEE